MSLHALLVDFGGVLTTNVFESFQEFSVAEGLEAEAVRKLFRERGEGLDLLRQLERGEVEVPDFERRFAPLLGVREPEGMVERLFAGVKPDEAMIDAVRRARAAGVPTGLISNSWGGTTYDNANIDELFDAVVISGEVGLHKPEPEIFHMGAERLGVAPEECVFVDDLRENCVGAEAVGMTAILHRGAEGTVPELERLLGVQLA
ncbi:MAG: putative hydrolase of the superfamily [Thermoleophilaceae bacterium]|nr:putative hydrolase of the superfamily [Thermoleophilaceae bacterium]